MAPDSAPLRRLHLLTSLEEADPLGSVASFDQRDRATQAAGVAEAPDHALAFLSRRADALLPTLSEAVREAVSKALSWPPSWLRWAGPAVLAGALLLGWLANELGPDRTINILSFPLLGLVLWNIVVCSLMFLAHLRKKGPAPGSQLESAIDGLAGHRKLTDKALAGISDPKQREILARGIAGHFSKWHALWRPWQAARWKIVFHAAALLLAGGVVGGMYVQGLRKEYRAAWESTFLDESGLHSLLRVVLGPASAVTGVEIPSAATLAAMRQHHNGEAAGFTAGSAAPFIHLWAATAALFIGLPRMILLVLALREKSRSRPDLEQWARPVVAALRREAGGSTPLVQIIPLHYSPEAPACDAVRQMALHLWGGKTRIEFLSKVELGGEESFLTGWEPPEGGVVVVVNFSTTPEMDVQGEFFHEMSRLCRKRLVIADALGFESRHQGMPEAEARLVQRRSAWERVLGPETAAVFLTESVRKEPDAAARDVRRKFGD